MKLEDVGKAVLGEVFFSHTNLEAAFIMVMDKMTGLNPESYAEVIGPSGAGKTTLRHILARALAGDKAKWKRGHSPVLDIRASNTSDGFFDSKDFYARLGYLVGAPFGVGAHFYQPGGLSDEGLEAAVAAAANRSRRVKGETETTIRQEAERMASARGLKFLLVDEAHVMGMVKRTREGISHLESLRAFCESIGCKLVVFGTYYLLDAWQASAEMNRRLKAVHLRRYDEMLPGEPQEFARCCTKLSEAFQFDSKEFVQSNFKLIYGLTLGIVGECHDLFEGAQNHARGQKRELITPEDLLWGLHTQSQLKTMYDEALFGELAMIRPDLKFLDEMRAYRRVGVQSAASQEPVLTRPRSACSRKRLRPGARKPTRDPVGKPR